MRILISKKCMKVQESVRSNFLFASMRSCMCIMILVFRKDLPYFQLAYIFYVFEIMYIKLIFLHYILRYLFFSRYLDSNQITSLDETIFNGLTVLRNLWVNCKHHIFATLVTRYDITFSQILTRFILFLTNFYLIIM